MASTWDIVSSAFLLAFFLGAVYLAIKISGALSSSTESTKSSLSSRGVTYQNGKLSVKTDRAAPSREEYIAQTQRAFEKGARTMSQHPDAFRTGKSGAGGVDGGVGAGPAAGGMSSGVETPEKKGFRRTKKLA